MPAYTSIFKRYEKKYKITNAQYKALMSQLGEYIVPDEFGVSTVYNIYFDTPDYRLIRNSLEKPLYKEKLRLRSYKKPTETTTTFVELKKKYNGVVYKRRIHMTYEEAIGFLCRGKDAPKNCNEQIVKEIQWFLKFYKNIKPVVSIFSDRVAYYCKDDHELRITFDTNIRFRDKNFDLAKGSDGNIILDNSEFIMEIKCMGAMPLWLTNELDKLEIFPSSFSKYGTAYATMFKSNPEKIIKMVG